MSRRPWHQAGAFYCTALTFTLALTLAGVSAMVQASENLGIHVNGQGEILVEPDLVRLTLQVNRQGRDAAALKKEMDQVTAKVLKLTDRLQVDRKDVTAAMVNIQPNYRYENNRQTMDGVTASRSIQITLRELDRIGTLMNDALELGINSIGGLTLDVSNRVELEQQALTQAIEDAKAEAARIAQEFGVRVAGVLNVRVGRHSVRPQVARMAMQSDEAESFSPGQITIRRDVEATFGIGGQ
ncbi:MAG: SIMPL domain-containing protein [Pseudomonadales bacterium]